MPASSFLWVMTWAVLLLSPFSFDIFRSGDVSGRAHRQSSALRMLTCSRGLAALAIFLLTHSLKVRPTNRAQRQYAFCPEILWWSSLIWILTRKTKGFQLRLQGKMNNINGLLPWKKKSNYMCIDFFKGWHWILRNILKSYLPSIGKLKGEMIFWDRRPTLKLGRQRQLQNAGTWWKGIRKMLTSLSHQKRRESSEAKNHHPFPVPFWASSQ